MDILIAIPGFDEQSSISDYLDSQATKFSRTIYLGGRMHTNEYCHLSTNQTLGGLEIVDAQFTETVFGKHAHAGVVISVVDAGVMHFSHRGASHDALPGPLSIVAPDELHMGSKGKGEGWRYRALYISLSDRVNLTIFIIQ